MSLEQNIFVIGRDPDDEDQLTEMLAWLLSVVPEVSRALYGMAAADLDLPLGATAVSTQYVIKGGRLDVLVEADELILVVESKLGSEYGPDQLRRYLEWLSGREASHRFLMTLTASAAPWTEDDLARAAKLGIGVAVRRWEELYASLEATLTDLDGLSRRLVEEFLESLTQEGLIPMEPLKPAELERMWGESAARIWRYQNFFTACIDAIGGALHMETRRGKSAQVDYVYQSFSTERDEILYVGLDAYDTDNPVPSSRSRGVPTVWLAVDASAWRDWEKSGASRLEKSPPPNWQVNPARRWGLAPQVWRYLDETIGSGAFAEQRQHLAEACAVGSAWITEARPGRRRTL